MSASRLALLLVVYVALDFANPLMPGAVSFEGGSVEAVDADGARPAVPVVDLGPVPVSRTVLDRGVGIQAPREPSPVPEHRRHAVTRTRRAPLSSSALASPSDDH
jgi:hypothetical protein